MMLTEVNQRCYARGEIATIREDAERQIRLFVAPEQFQPGNRIARCNDHIGGSNPSRHHPDVVTVRIGIVEHRRWRRGGEEGDNTAIAIHKMNHRAPVMRAHRIGRIARHIAEDRIEPALPGRVDTLIDVVVANFLRHPNSVAMRTTALSPAANHLAPSVEIPRAKEHGMPIHQV